MAEAFVPQPNPNADPALAPGPISYLALVLAWCVPGLGHILIGQKAHGIIILAAIHGLFAAGLLVGGIRALNPQEQPIWTYTQFLAGWPMVIGNRIEKAKEKDVELLQDEYASNRPDVAAEHLPGESPAEYQKRNDAVRQEREAYGQKFFADHPVFTYHPKVQDIGSVYCGIAGMLNLLVMFDVLLRITGTARETPDGKKAGTAAGQPGAGGTA